MQLVQNKLRFVKKTLKKKDLGEEDLKHCKSVLTTVENKLDHYWLKDKVTARAAAPFRAVQRRVEKVAAAVRKELQLYYAKRDIQKTHERLKLPTLQWSNKSGFQDFLTFPYEIWISMNNGIMQSS